MSRLYLHEVSGLNPQRTYICSEYDFATAFRLRTDAFQTSGLSIGQVHAPDLEKPWLGIRFSSRAEAIESAEESVISDLFRRDGATNLIAPLTSGDVAGLPNLTNPRTYATIKGELMTKVFDGYAGSISDPDVPISIQVQYAKLTGLWNTCDVDLFVKGGVVNDVQTYTMVNRGTTLPTSNIPEYYQCSKKFSNRFVSTDGVYTITFGVRSFCYYRNGYPANYSEVHTGIAQEYYKGSNNSEYALSLNGYSIGASGTSPDGVGIGLTTDYLTADPSVDWCGATTVHFIIPQGTQLTSTFTTDKDYIMFGFVAYTRSAITGKIESLNIWAVEDKCWKSAEHRTADMGDDSEPGGGNGPFKAGTENPYDKINKTKTNGISTDPTAGGGLFIYKFTDSEWESFAKSLSTSWNVGENVDHVRFIYKSPIDFPTKNYTLRGIKMGTTGINYDSHATPHTYKVVQNTVVEFPAEAETFWEAKTFSDLEPYSSTQIHVPFCSSLNVPPSLIASYDDGKYGDPTIKVDTYYDILTKAASGTVSISRQGFGTIKYNVFGECAASCPSVLKKDSTTQTLASIAPVVASGVATVATGGTFAPALAGTIAGAATNAIANSTPMAQIDLPSTSSNNPYFDTINSGLRNCAITGVRTPRLNAGEDAIIGNTRGQLIGYRSGFCEQISKISKSGKRTYLEVERVDLIMGSVKGAITKAQADEIVALLKEGVII